MHGLCGELVCGAVRCVAGRHYTTQRGHVQDISLVLNTMWWSMVLITSLFSTFKVSSQTVYVSKQFNV